MARPALKKSRPRITLGLLCCLRLLFLGIEDRGSRSDEGCVKRLTPLTRRAPPGPKRATFTRNEVEDGTSSLFARKHTGRKLRVYLSGLLLGTVRRCAGGSRGTASCPRSGQTNLPNEPSLLGSRPRSSNRRRQARACSGLTPL